MKFYIFPIVLILTVFQVNAADFSPTRLTLDAPYMLELFYEGRRPVEIPVTVSGTPASVTLLIFTNNLATSIRKTQNGHLGWHYVNKIDTCIYISSPQQCNIGQNTLVWSGKDQDGVWVPFGTYTYYLFGFDNKSSKTPVAEHMPFLWDDTSNIVTYDEQGYPLSNPRIYSGVNEWKTQQEPWERIRRMWVIGYDPGDETLIETTLYSGWNEHCRIIPLIPEFGRFFISTIDNDLIGHLQQYEWVPNGEAELQTDWGDNGEFLWEVYSTPGEWSAFQPLEYKEDSYLVTTNTDFKGVSDVSEVVFVDIGNGEEIKRIDLSKWWIRYEDGNSGGQKSSGPTDIIMKHDRMVLSSHSSCLTMMIDPYAENDDDLVLWINGNGDYIGDKNFSEDSTKPWVCHDYEAASFTYTISLDENLISMFPADGLGVNSFGLYAPDGSGIGYFSFANETAGNKFGQHIINYGSAFDGIYCDNAALGDQGKGWWYVASDTATGIIGGHTGINFRVVTPNGGEILESGSVYTIIWNAWIVIKSSNQTDGYMQIEFSSDSGENWMTIAKNLDLYSESYSWTVPSVESVRCLIKISNMNNPAYYADTSENFFTITKKTSVDDNTPASFKVSQNSPNPFNPATTITFTTPEAGTVTAEIFNTAGQKVEMLTSGFFEAGSHTLTWNAVDYPAGIYFCTVKCGKFSDSVKMTLLR